MPLRIIRQDITKMRVDAIVNTTNREKIGYSGVDLAVHTIAGSGLDEECAKLPPLGLGQAQITGGVPFALQIRDPHLGTHVVWRDTRRERDLALLLF